MVQSVMASGLCGKNNKERMNIGKSIPSNFYPNHPWWYRLRCVLYLQRYNATHGCVA